jgi:hypothetical protein
MNNLFLFVDTSNKSHLGLAMTLKKRGLGKSYKLVIVDIRGSRMNKYMREKGITKVPSIRISGKMIKPKNILGSAEIGKFLGLMPQGRRAPQQKFDTREYLNQQVWSGAKQVNSGKQSRIDIDDEDDYGENNKNVQQKITSFMDRRPKMKGVEGAYQGGQDVNFKFENKKINSDAEFLKMAPQQDNIGLDEDMGDYILEDYLNRAVRDTAGDLGARRYNK